jgi:hypothetical protein
LSGERQAPALHDLLQPKRWPLPSAHPATTCRRNDPALHWLQCQPRSLIVAMPEPIRLTKRVMELANCSRREAEQYIMGGWVLVDGKVVDAPQFIVVKQRIALSTGSTSQRPGGGNPGQRIAATHARGQQPDRAGVCG